MKKNDEWDNWAREKAFEHYSLSLSTIDNIRSRIKNRGFSLIGFIGITFGLSINALRLSNLRLNSFGICLG